MSSRGGLRSIRHSSRCLTASKLIVPSCKASSMARVTSMDEKVSSRRSTCTYSRPPCFFSLASSKRRSVAKHSGNCQPSSGAA